MSEPRVLVVDDEEHITELVAMALGINGFEVERVASGRSALAAIEARRPDLVWMDLDEVAGVAKQPLRVDHEVEEGEIPGVVVARVNMSQQFASELLAALQDAHSKYLTVKGIQDLPETDG